MRTENLLIPSNIRERFRGHSPLRLSFSVGALLMTQHCLGMFPIFVSINCLMLFITNLLNPASAGSRFLEIVDELRSTIDA